MLPLLSLLTTFCLSATACLKAGLDVVDWQGTSTAGSKQPKKGWTPRQGEVVRVVKMGGAPGTVVTVPQGQGSSRKVSVRVGSLTMEMRVADLLPMAGGGSAAKAQPAAGARAVGADREAVASRAEARRAKEKLRAEGVLEAGSQQSDSSSSGPGLAVAIQTTRNTVDVRGKMGDEAVSEVEAALNVARPGSALFVIHGVGTGRVRSAVRDAVKRNKLVLRWEEQAESLGGCTIVYVKP